ncbi:MAG: hypothetical protein RQ757_10270 [Pseudomonadales bacterium]|nr:hypothetical protein [Pseudomonadales bacterium]
MGFAGKEMQRQACLREMGIFSYFPRQALSGTHARRSYDKTVITAPVDTPTKPEQNPAQDIEETKPAIPISAPAPADAAIEGPRFAFAYCVVAANLAVICETPNSHQGRLQAPARGLLMAILKALGVTVAEHNLRFIPFQWPMYDGQDMASDMTGARDVLQGFLAREVRAREIGTVLVFSEQWPAYLFPDSFSVPDERALITHPGFPFSVLVTHGLHAMLADEALKRPVWGQLQQIKTRLVSG